MALPRADRGGHRIPDPLDHRVVEAYWVGNSLLDTLRLGDIASSMEDRFRPRTGLQFPHLVESVLAGGVPHHSFHVFCVYPWVGLLRDDRKAPAALSVLDRCRTRWGQVVSLDGDRALVRSRPLVWDGRDLGFGPVAVESAIRSRDGLGYLGSLAPGDWVSLYWDWVCDRLTARQLHYTVRQLEITNHGVAHRSAALAVERG